MGLERLLQLKSIQKNLCYVEMKLKEINDIFDGNKDILVINKESPLLNNKDKIFITNNDKIYGTITLSNSLSFNEKEFEVFKSYLNLDNFSLKDNLLIRIKKTYKFVQNKFNEMKVSFTRNKSVQTFIKKSSDEERIFGAAVLIPDVPDLHGEIYDEETVRNAAHYFMENYLQDDEHGIDVQHNEIIIPEGIKVIQSFVLDEDKTFDVEVPALNDEHPVKSESTVSFPKGTWIMYAKIEDDELWEDVKEGKYNSWSISGWVTSIDISQDE